MIYYMGVMAKDKREMELSQSSTEPWNYGFGGDPALKTNMVLGRVVSSTVSFSQFSLHHKLDLPHESLYRINLVRGLRCNNKMLKNFLVLIEKPGSSGSITSTLIATNSTHNYRAW